MDVRATIAAIDSVTVDIGLIFDRRRGYDVASRISNDPSVVAKAEPLILPVGSRFYRGVRIHRLVSTILERW
jgi:hypothetical protein